MRKRSLLLGDSISKWNIDFQVDSHSEGCEGRVFRGEREVYFLVIEFTS